MSKVDKRWFITLLFIGLGITGFMRCYEKKKYKEEIINLEYDLKSVGWSKGVLMNEVECYSKLRENISEDLND